MVKEEKIKKPDRNGDSQYFMMSKSINLIFFQSYPVRPILTDYIPEPETGFGIVQVRKDRFFLSHTIPIPKPVSWTCNYFYCIQIIKVKEQNTEYLVLYA